MYGVGSAREERQRALQTNFPREDVKRRLRGLGKGADVGAVLQQEVNQLFGGRPMKRRRAVFAVFGLSGKIGKGEIK